MSAMLTELLQKQPIWRGGHSEQPARYLASGQPRLDEAIGGGWPQGALTELMVATAGIGELRLLMPALANLSRTHWVALINPPYLPYAPAFASHGVELQHLLIVRPGPHDRLWAAEQCLRSNACGAVVSWFDRLDFRRSRRLQLAAEAGQGCGFIFRQESSAEASAAALRISLEHFNSTLQLTVLKRRGGFAQQRVAMQVH